MTEIQNGDDPESINMTKSSEDNNGKSTFIAKLFTAIESAAVGHRMLVNIIAHNILFALAFLMAYIVRFDAGKPGSMAAQEGPWFTEQFLTFLPFFLIVKSLLFSMFKLFHGHWRYTSTRDAARIGWASWWFLLIAFTLRMVFVEWPKEPLFSFSQGVLLLDFVLTIFIVCFARLSVRLYREEIRPVSTEGLTRVVIVGATDAAETIIREINRMKVDRYRVEGIVDDDPRSQGLYIHELPVLGTTDQLKEICAQHEIDEILIAMPAASQKELRRVVELCTGINVKFKTLPGVTDLISERFTVSQIKSVDINDLLGRQAINLDHDAIGRFIKDRAILITGAGGSIGSEMCRQIAAVGPERLILLEQAENPIFEIQNELRRSWPELPVSAVICDIYDRQRVMEVFDIHRPQVVIHAAAHKHVPLMEHNPCEAVKNNILGTRNVADASSKFGVAEFVMISTDKAVNPSSVMGCSKRVAELYCQSLNWREGNNTQFKAVRFGNVLGSAGSVVPIFKRQIAEGGPVCVTHPEMTRYFMTIPEASQLVLQAAATGTGGQIFLLDMGEPVKIVDLARDIIILSGFRPDVDIEIKFIGVRPGEKLFEELKTDGEDIVPTTHEKVNVWQTDKTDWQKLQQSYERFEKLANCTNRDEIVEALKFLVPEYTPLNPPEKIKKEVGDNK